MVRLRHVLCRACVPALAGLLALAGSSGAVAVTAEDPPGKSEPAPSAGVEWKSFHPSAFQRAASEGRLILLVLDVPWSASVPRADREVWSHPDVVAAIRAGYVPVRERADLRPDLKRRYPAEGWPAVSLVLPDGTPLVYDTQDESARRRVTAGALPATQMADLLRQASGYWKSARPRAIENARAHLETMKDTARPKATPLRETLYWSVGRRLQTTFDPEARYFGGPPRIPRYEVLELMLLLSGEDPEGWEAAGLAALQTLDDKLVDDDGGVMRMALGLDWSGIQREKLLDRSASHVALLADAYRLTGRRSLRDAALKTAGFMTKRLSAGDAFASALCESCPGGRDETVLTGANAMAATALIRAGSILEAPELLDRGLAAARFLRKERYTPGRLSPTGVVAGRPSPPDNVVLDDQASLTHAFLAAFEATGDPAWLEAAKDLASSVVSNFGDRELAALSDIIPNPSAPAPLRFGLFPQDANAEMARALVRLGTFTGERRFRDAARRILTAFAGSYEDAPLRQAVYATAVYELLMPPVVVHIVAKAGDESAAAMRRAAMRSPIPYTLVRSWRPETDSAVLQSLGMTIAPGAGSWVAHGGLLSTRNGRASGIPAQINDARDKHVRQREERRQREIEKQQKEAADR